MLEFHSVTRIILMENLTEQDAYMLETFAKETLMSFGYPLIDYERKGANLNQRRGIEEAKQLGKYKGRQRVSISNELWDKQYKAYMHREISKVEFAKRLGVSRPTLDKLLKEKI